MYQTIVTYAAFKALIEAILSAANWQRPEGDENKTIDADVLWFISMKRAQEVEESMNRRELAIMFLAGIPATDEKAVEGWLEGFYADVGTLASEPDKQRKCIELTNRLLMAEVKHFYQLIDEGERDNEWEYWQEATSKLR